MGVLRQLTGAPYDFMAGRSPTGGSGLEAGSGQVEADSSQGMPELPGHAVTPPARKFRYDGRLAPDR
ncbi:hypothetical protein GCM10010264_35020 [Streptomyces globisporus]|nr:hypothetical protein GCM10010264_35020 [Streptomyces globisporus]